MLARKKMLMVFAFVLIFSSIFSLVSAAPTDFNYVVSNSEDWKDVYSIMHYARLNDVGSDFLVSPRHGPLLLGSLNKGNDIRVISASGSSFVINFDDQIRNEGFADADEVVVNNANLDLIEELPEVKNFIIVGSTYGYSAIAVNPYAVVNQAWVFLADRSNIDEIDAILSERGAEEVLIYGYVDREVRQTLEKYEPEVIDTGDRFKDNIEIVEKYLEINPIKQVILTNGEFIEKSIMSGSEPILFTGKENVPDQISNYIKSSDFEVGVLVGADLVGAATNIRRSTGISVIVKFARGARAPTGSIAAVEGLDLFYLPVPILNLDVHSAKYNRANSQLELTYKSTSNIPVFFKGTLTPKSGSEESTRIGDVDPVFIAPNDFKTVVYPDVELNGDDLSLELFTLYGDTPTSLEKILEKTVDLESVNVIDGCEINIEGVDYSKQKDSFAVKVENTGSADCWVDVELENVLVDNARRTLGSDGSIKVESGKSGKILIEQEMTDEDLAENSFVDVTAYYGEREDGLIKILKGRFELKIQLISYATIGLMLVGLIVVIALIVLLVMWRKRRNEDDF